MKKIFSLLFLVLIFGCEKIINLDLPTDDPKQRKPDLSKAKTILNYNPIHKLEDGLEITVKWFKENYK